MTGTVAQFIRILERLAPRQLAEAWDNVGLQLGSRDWPVKKIWTALDPLPEVVSQACENGVDLLVTHHPLLFKPLTSIDCATPLGEIIRMALSRQLAIYSAHTNLDSVKGGVNDVLAERIGLSQLRVLGEPGLTDRCKLVIFVPSTHVKVLLDTLFAMDVGRLDSYSCCTFRCGGVGTFLAGVDSSPSIGSKGTLTEVQESRVEILVPAPDLDPVVDALKKVHPYESMAYDVYPIAGRDGRTGLGRVGELSSAATLGAFAERLKSTLHIPMLRMAGNANLNVKTVAVCSGSGSSLLNAAIGSGAQVYVSGDLGYHTARDAEQAGIGLVDIGHFASERLIVESLATSIREASRASGFSVTVAAVDSEADPFHYL